MNAPDNPYLYLLEKANLVGVDHYAWPAVALPNTQEVYAALQQVSLVYREVPIDPQEQETLYLLTPRLLLLLAQSAAKRVDVLQNAIAEHRNAQGHARCWENDVELYQATGFCPPHPNLPPIQEHRIACDVYRAGLYNVEVEHEPAHQSFWKWETYWLTGLFILWVLVSCVQLLLFLLGEKFFQLLQ